MLAATISLGRWQLSRAAQKEALQAEIEAQKTLPALDQDQFLALEPATSAMHRPVRLHGLWLAPHTVYLDNRQMHGLPGFYVLTPFAIEGSNQTVLVQRGWVQRNFTDRTQLAPIETPSGLVELVARVAPPPAHLFELGKEAPPPAAAPGSSPIRQNLDLEAFREQTGLPLRTDVSLLQTGAAAASLPSSNSCAGGGAITASISTRPGGVSTAPSCARSLKLRCSQPRCTITVSLLPSSASGVST